MDKDYDNPETEMETEDIISTGRVDPAAELTMDLLPAIKKNVNVTEKIVFCIDRVMCQRNFVKKLCTALSHFMDVKKAISSKPVEYGIATYNTEEADTFSSYDPVIFTSLISAEKVENDILDLTYLFDSLAATCELPDPSICQSQPPYIYHFILFYGSNDSIPILKSANSYNFLFQSKFVTLDILHLTRSSSLKCEKISEILQCLVPGPTGFFEKSDSSNLHHTLMKFVGNPCLR